MTRSARHCEECNDAAVQSIAVKCWSLTLVILPVQREDATNGRREAKKNQKNLVFQKNILHPTAALRIIIKKGVAVKYPLEYLCRGTRRLALFRLYGK
jgi:hypothetical protein